MVRDLGLRLNAQPAPQRGIAAEFGQAGLVRGMAEQRGQDGDAPEDRDWVIVATAAPRRAQPLEDRRVGNGLKTAADGAQGRAILEAGPVEEGLRSHDSHTPGPPLGRGVQVTS